MKRTKKIWAVLLGVMLLMNCFATTVAFAEDTCTHDWAETYENVVYATETDFGSADVVKTCSKCGDTVRETVRYSYPTFEWLEELSGILVASFNIEGKNTPHTLFASEENSAYASYVQTFFKHYVTEDCHSFLSATFQFYGAEYTYEEEGAHRVMYFGNYPQTRVDDEALLAELDAAEKEWISYGYYVGTGYADGLMEQTDIMEYADLFLNGAKYRAVKINEHRPTATRQSLNSANQTIIQEAFGYHKNNTYYFKFEPVSWSVLDEDSGLVLSDKLLDAQSFQNFVLQQNNTIYADADCTVLANSYRDSSVRAWLNEDFYNTAFTASQKAQILTTELEDGLTDKIFLLSADDVVNTAYGFNASGTAEDELRAGALRNTDYALSQGLCCYPVGTNFNWWIRSMPEMYSAYAAAGYVGTMDDTGAYSGYTSDWVNMGVRPTMRVEAIRHDRTIHEHTIAGTVIWDDDNDRDGIRPSSFTIDLYAGEEKIDSKTVTAADDWSWNFTGPTYDETGTEIVYTIKAESVDGYTSTIDGYDVTNKHVPETSDPEPEYVTIAGGVTWDDDNDRDGIRPSSFTIELYAGDEKVESKTVTAEDGWSWNFTGPKYNETGTEIVYSLKAVSVDGYTSTVDGYDVTNKHASGTGDSGSTGTFTGTRKIVFYAPDRVSYQIKDGWHIIDNATLNFDVNETVYFKPITSYGNFNTLVYVNEKLVEPGEDGWYAVEPGTLPVLVSVAPGFTDEKTGKSTSVWDQLISFVKQIFNAIINLFKKG